MSAVINWIRNEPAVSAALLGVIATLAISIPSNQPLLGAIVSALQVVLGAIVRSQVTPVVKLGRSSH